MEALGAVIAACILEYTRGQIVNAMTFDLMAVYRVEEGSTCGTGETEPDTALNADLLLECANYFFPLILFDPMRRVICIDSSILCVTSI